MKYFFHRISVFLPNPARAHTRLLILLSSSASSLGYCCYEIISTGLYLRLLIPDLRRSALPVRWFLEDKIVPIRLPEGIFPANTPIWALDGQQTAFAVDQKNGVDLWGSDTRSGICHKIEGLQL